MAAQRRTREEWARLVAEAARSTVAETARRHRLCPKSLRWWRWRLESEQPSRPTSPRMLPVVVRSPTVRDAEPSDEVRIELGGDVLLRVPASSDVHFVAALVAALRTTC